jgi:hypothetical protein
VSKGKDWKREGERDESDEEASQEAEGKDTSCTLGALNAPAVDPATFTRGILGHLDWDVGFHRRVT